MITNLMMEILGLLPLEQGTGAYRIHGEGAGRRETTLNRSADPLSPLRLDFSNLRGWKERLPSIEPSHFPTLLKVMGKHSLPLTPEVARALDAFLFGPPLGARMGELLRLLSEDRSPTVKELKGLWEELAKRFSLEEMARMGIMGEGERSLPLYRLMSVQELLHRLKEEKVPPSSLRLIHDLDLWFTGQQLLLRQDGEANYFHTLFRFPFYHRDEPSPSFMEIMGKRKGKGFDPENFSLSLSMELPSLGEIALRLYLVGRKASLYFFSDLENGRRLFTVEEEGLKEGLEALGYRLGEVRWASLSSLKKNGRGDTAYPFPKPRIDDRV